MTSASPEQYNPSGHYGFSGERIQEWANNWGAQQAEVRHQRIRLWESVVEANQYKVMSDTPTAQLGFFAADPTTHNPFDDLPLPLAPEEHERLQGVYGDLTKTIEEAILSNPDGNVGMETFMRFDIDDLRLLKADELGIDLDWLQSRMFTTASHQQFTQLVEDEVNRRYEVYARSNDFGLRAEYTAKRMMDFFNPAGDNPFGQSAGEFQAEQNLDPERSRLRGTEAADLKKEELRKEVWLEFTGKRDQVYEEEIAAWREKRRLQILEEEEISWVFDELGIEGDPREMFGEVTWDTMDQFLNFSPLDPDDPDGSKYTSRLEKYEDLKRQRLRWSDERSASGPAQTSMGKGATMADRLAQEEAILREMIIAGGDPAELLATNGILSASIHGATELMGFGLTKVVEGIGGLLWLIDGPLPGKDVGVFSPYQYFVQRQRNRVEEGIEEYERTVLAQGDQEVLMRATQIGAEAAWQEIVEERGEAYEQYMGMAAGNEMMAAGFFIADVHESPTVADQLENLIKEQRAADQAYTEDLKEQDFRFSHEMLDVIQMYGRNIAGRGLTAVTLLATDRDMQDNLTNGQWKKLWHELGDTASSMDFSASKALGLDGSMAGLMLELGGGIIFDPATYLFGPRFGGAGKGAALGTVDNAAMLARSAPVRQMVDDIIAFAQSPGRGGGAVFDLASWLDDTARGEILEITGLVDNILPARPWQDNPRGAVEVSLDFLNQLIDDAQIQAGVANADSITALGDDILKEGFKEAGTITISRADRTIHFTDGVKRALAASEKGVNRMPVRLRLVDDAASGSWVHPGGMFKPEHAERLQKIARGEHIESKKTVKGADDTARQDSLQIAYDIEAGVVPETVVSDVIASIPMPGKGQNLAVKKAVQQIDGETNHVYYAIDPTGEIVSSLVSTELKGITMGTAEAFGGKGVMEYLFRVAHKNGDFVLLNSGRSPSMSTAAKDFTARLAQKLLDESTGQLSTSGKLLDDILQGKELKRTLKGIDEAAGEAVGRIDNILPGEVLFGKLDRASIDAAVERAIMRGSKPHDGARRGVMARTLRSRFAQAYNSTIPYEVRSFFTTANTVRRMDLHGPHAIEDIITNINKIWGDDIISANGWTQKVLQFQVDAARGAKAKAARLAVLAPQRRYIQRMQELNQGGQWDNIISQLKKDVAQGKATPAELGLAKANKAMVDKLLKEEMKSFERAHRNILKDLGALPDQKQLKAIVEEMYDEFNRTNIVPRWKKAIAKNPEILDAEKGIVKWEHLQKGTLKRVERATDGNEGGFLTESMKSQLKDLDIEDGEAFYRLLNSIPDTPMALEAHLSPLEMIAASTITGSAFIRWTQTATRAAVRDIFLGAQKAWVIDKVLRPATAFVVSGDELLRIFHEGGRWAVGRYLMDRKLFMQARIQAGLNAGKGNSSLKAFASRDAVRQGARYSPKVQERLRELDRWVTKADEWERIFYDDHGIGWTDIFPDDPIYRQAAQQWSANWMQQSGFRAFLRGEEAFTEWFHGVDGEQMRNATILKSANETGIANAADAYQGWKTLFDDVILKHAKENGRYAEVREMIVDTAKQIDAAGGKPINLPEMVIDNLGPIRGTAKHSSSKMSPTKLFDPFFDRLFLDPVNYRRGFLADMVAQTEKARIEGLFKSQGSRIISDIELEEALGYKGVAGASRMGVKGWLVDEALKRGLVPQSHIDDLVQRAVNAEMDHVLYVAEQGSRAGRIAQMTVFPFGKPYADMVAYWGREMMRRPVLRGWWNEENAFNLPNLISFNGAWNPRTAALISRISNADFNIDRGWVGGDDESRGLLPGSESTNLSPLLFLPTDGENPMLAMLPGLGYLPMWSIDMVLGALKDPVADPLGYQQLLDSVGEFVPGVAFGSADPVRSAVQRGLGGGTAAQLMEAALDLFGSVGRPTNPALSSILGQIDREVDRGRHASAILADPEEWTRILEFTDADALDLYVNALSLEADQNAARGNLSEMYTRFALPANSKYSGELDMIWDVWLRAGEKYPMLGGNHRYDDSKATPEQRREYADDIRENFFNLPQVDRDRLVAADPTLAVNLVSSWTWTDAAYTTGVPGTDRDYRTTGDQEGLARHQTYLDNGLIRPLSPSERLRRIIGLHLNAKEKSYKALYEEVAHNVNGLLWTALVPDEDKATMDLFYRLFEAEFQKVDIRSGEELWQQWGTYEEVTEDLISDALGIEKLRGVSTRKDDLTEYDKLRRNVKFDVAPWSPRWPGKDPDDLPKRMAKLPLFEQFIFDDTVRNLAESMEIDLTHGMTGEQLYNAVQMGLTGMNQTLKTYVNPSYEQYVGGRSVVNRAVDNELNNLANNQRYSEEWRQQVSDFMTFEQSMSARWREEPLGMPGAEQLRVQQRFIELYNTADDTVVTDWDRLWELVYERGYGPLEWKPPTPRAPSDTFRPEDRTWDSPVNGAYQPYIRTVIDGDSLLVRDHGSGPYHEVRLLGVRARDYGLDDPGADEDKDRLWDAIEQAKVNGDTIWLVRDPMFAGRHVDIYGRELAWLWIGDQPFYFEDEMLPNRDRGNQ